jgi:hypothetical protein
MSEAMHKRIRGAKVTRLCNESPKSRPVSMRSLSAIASNSYAFNCLTCCSGTEVRSERADICREREDSAMNGAVYGRA